MDTFEIFNHITSQPKWYAGIKTPNGFMSAQTASMIKKRFYDCTLSKNKIELIFNHYGYYLQENWVDKNTIDSHCDIIMADCKINMPTSIPYLHNHNPFKEELPDNLT